MINMSLAAITDFTEYLRTKVIRTQPTINLLVRNRTLQFRTQGVRGGVRNTRHRSVCPTEQYSDSAVV